MKELFFILLLILMLIIAGCSDSNLNVEFGSYQDNKIVNEPRSDTPVIAIVTVKELTNVDGKIQASIITKVDDFQPTVNSFNNVKTNGTSLDSIPVFLNDKKLLKNGKHSVEVKVIDINAEKVYSGKYKVSVG